MSYTHKVFTTCRTFRVLATGLALLAGTGTLQAAHRDRWASADALATAAAQHIDSVWRRSGYDYTPPRKVVSYEGSGTSACGALSANNAFYCPADQSIYYDVNLLERVLGEGRDFGVVAILAHEWGHHLQSTLGTGARMSIERELQADCLAGAYAAAAVDDGLLDPGDLEEGAMQMYAVGDRGVPWFHPGAHGSPRQRHGAFLAGLRGGARAC